MKNRLVLLGILLSVVILGFGRVVYADPGAQLTITSTALSDDHQWILVVVTLEPKQNSELSGQFLLALDASYRGSNGFRVFNSQSTIIDASGVFQYTFQVPYQGDGRYKFVAMAYSYPSLAVVGIAVSDPPAVGTK